MAGTTNFKYVRVPADEAKYGKGFSLNTLAHEEYNSFNENVLGLGDIATEGHYVEAIAAFIDLEKFTEFCDQSDSHLIIPEFLKEYLGWLFKSTRESFREGEADGRVRIWGSLPIYSKFLGDGVYFLWDTRYLGGLTAMANVISNLCEIHDLYVRDFYPYIRKKVNNPPQRIRIGVARGRVMSIGNGTDYVGSCVNLSARLQKLASLSFVVSRTGYDIEKSGGPMSRKLIPKNTTIRGVGEQLILVMKEQFDKMSKEEKAEFRDP